jgi:hypothetical protein
LAFPAETWKKREPEEVASPARLLIPDIRLEQYLLQALESNHRLIPLACESGVRPSTARFVWLSHPDELEEPTLGKERSLERERRSLHP